MSGLEPLTLQTMYDVQPLNVYNYCTFRKERDKQALQELFKWAVPRYRIHSGRDGTLETSRNPESSYKCHILHVKYYNTKVHLTFFLILHNLNTVCFITINNIKFIRRWNKNLTFVHITIKDKRKKYIQDVCHLKKLCFKVTRGGHALLLLALSLFALCK